MDSNTPTIKISELADRTGILYNKIYQAFRAGEIEGAYDTSSRLPSGHYPVVLYDDDALKAWADRIASDGRYELPLQSELLEQEEDLVTASHACAELGLSRQTVLTWLTKGRLNEGPRYRARGRHPGRTVRRDHRYLDLLAERGDPASPGLTDEAFSAMSYDEIADYAAGIERDYINAYRSARQELDRSLKERLSKVESMRTEALVRKLAAA